MSCAFPQNRIFRNAARFLGALIIALSFAFPCAVSADETPPEKRVPAKTDPQPVSTQRKENAKISGDELVLLGWTDLGGLRGALLNGANPNARTRVGDYPIIRLAYGGNVEAVEILLDFGAKTNVLNLQGDAGSSAGTLKSLTTFVTENEKMGLKNFSVATAIICASPQVSRTQKIRMLQLILDYGYPTDFRDGWGKTALMTCVREGQDSLAKLLVGYGADGEANDLTNGKTARDYANSETMFRILRGRKIYSPSKRPTFGKVEVRLKKPRKYPTRSRETAPKKVFQATRETVLHLAVKDGDVQAVRELIAAGTPIIAFDLDQKTPLHRLCEQVEIPFSAFREIHRMMELESGSKIHARKDKYGRVPFHYLCISGREDLAEFVAKKYPKLISAADNDRNTPLHLAVAAGDNAREVVRFLLNSGAPVTEKNRANETPLHIAVNHANAEMFYLLFNELNIDPVAGINSLVGDPLFMRAFSLISANRSAKDNENLIEILRVLIEYGTSPNLSDPVTGRNALHYAVIAGSASAVSYLLSTDINVNERDHAGETPLDLAKKSDRTRAIRFLLEERGALIGKAGAEEKHAERERRAKMTPQERRAERLEQKKKN
ncbi:MAG: ankyrin repeat domain-containing protein [Opitutales bacterium]|nr:ankyrin repeat domain-containing protein [Opitutales bacterium]